MKRTLCLILALSLSAMALSGCRRKAEEASEETSSGGPGYTVTDGSNFEPEQTNSVPDPLATLTPQQLAAMQMGSGEGVPEDELLSAGGDTQNDGSASSSDLFAPIEVAPDPEPMDTPMDASTEAPADTSTQQGAINPAAYQYSAVMDDNLDYTFNYPSHWEHVPGIYTVCFREPVEKGDFPARISICRKKLVHTPDDIAMMEQLTSYMKMVAERYDAATFQTSTPDKEARFMGHPALSNTYLAYWGNVEVKGYVVGVAINRTLYVLHFCATYNDYNAMQGVLEYMVKSVALKNEEKK